MVVGSVQAAVSKFFEVNRQTLCQEMPHVPPDADALLATQRSRMHAAHRLVCGQELCVIFQVWQPVPGHVTQRQLCPLVTYGGAQNKASFTEQLNTTAPAKMEPVFQFVAGQKYYLSFLIQNRDPTSLKKLPFTDCIEVRTCMAPRPSAAVPCTIPSTMAIVNILHHIALIAPRLLHERRERPLLS